MMMWIGMGMGMGMGICRGILDIVHTKWKAPILPNLV